MGLRNGLNGGDIERVLKKEKEIVVVKRMKLVKSDMSESESEMNIGWIEVIVQAFRYEIWRRYI